jgi:hypothetical protein
MFIMLDNLFRPKNEKKPLDNFVDNESVVKVKCKICLRKFESHYVKCPYCDCSVLHRSILAEFLILRGR